MTDNERLFALVDILKNQERIKTYVELADILGTNKAGINDLKSGKKKVSLDHVRSMKKAYSDINIDYLLFDADIPFLDQPGDRSAEANETFRLRTDVDQENQRIPLYDIEAAAGLVKLFNNKQSVLDYISIPNLPKCDGAVHVTGDSMYPLLKSGDIIMYKVVNDINHGIFWGEMYLLSISVDDGEYATVKYIQKSDLGDTYVKLVSQNSHHDSKDILISSIRALAYVKASIRINSMT